MSDMPTVRLVLRNDLAADWAAANPLLEAGEVGVEVDTLKAKVGDGERYWNSLPYIADAGLLAKIAELTNASPSDVGTLASAGSSAEAARADHVHALPQNISVSGAIAAASASVVGNLTIGGSLIGGAHRHEASDIDGLVVPSRLSDLENDAGFLTADGIPAQSVTSVNGQVGEITLDAADVGALPANTSIPSKTSQLDNDSGYITGADIVVSGLKAGANVALSMSAENVWTISATTGGEAPVTSVNGQTGDVTIAVPANLSELQNDKGFVSLADVFPSYGPAESGKVLTVGASGSTQWSAISFPVTSVNGRSGSVQLSALELNDFPHLSGNAGKYLATNGLVMSWETVATPVSSVAGRTGAVTLSLVDVQDFPSRSGNSGKYLTTDGFSVLWATPPTAPVLSVNGKTGAVVLGLQDVGLPSVASAGGKVLSTDGSAVAWTATVTSVNSKTGAVSLTASSLPDFPPQSGNAGKYLATTGSSLEWKSVSTGVSSVAGRSGDVTLGTGDIAAFSEGVRNVIRGTLRQGANIILTQDPVTGEVDIAAQADSQFVAGVSSINGETGDVTLSVPDTNDIRSVLKATLVPGDGIALTEQEDSTLLVSSTLGGGGWTGGPDYRPVYVVDQPADVVAVGGQAQFSVGVAGGTPPITYEWQRTPRGLQQWQSIAQDSRVSGADSPLVTISQLTADDHNYSYRCVIRALVDAVVSREALLETVTLKLSALETQQLELLADQAAPEDALAARATCASPISYQWVRSEDYSPTTGEGAWVAVAGATNYLYGSFAEQLPAGIDSKIVWYKCRVSAEGATLETEPCRVTVRRSVLVITQHPQNLLVSPEDFSNPAYTRVTLPDGRKSIEVPFTVQYVKEGSAPRITWLESEDGSSWVNATGRVSGSAPNVLWVDVVERTPRTTWFAAQLRFSEPNGDGTYSTVTRESEAAYLFVDGPRIIRQPMDAEANLGLASFDVVADAPSFASVDDSGADISYQWYKIAANGGTAGTVVSGATRDTLSLTGLTTQRNGEKYYCIVSFGGWSVTSDTATLTVRSDVNAPAEGLAPGAAVFTRQPQGGVLREGDRGPLVRFETALKTLNGQTVSYGWEYYDADQDVWRLASGHPDKSVLFATTNYAFYRLPLNTITDLHNGLRLRGWAERGGDRWYTSEAVFEVTKSVRIIAPPINFDSGQRQMGCVEIKNFNGVLFAIMEYGASTSGDGVGGFVHDYYTTGSRELFRSLDDGKTWTKVNVGTVKGWWCTMCMHRGRLHLIGTSVGRINSRRTSTGVSYWHPIVKTRILSLAEANLTKPVISNRDWKDERPRFTLYHSAGAASDGNRIVIGHNLGVVSGTSISTATERAPIIPQETDQTSFRNTLSWRLPYVAVGPNTVFVLYSPVTQKWIVAGGVYSTGGDLTRAGCGCRDMTDLYRDKSCWDRDCRTVTLPDGTEVVVDEMVTRSVGNAAFWSQDGVTFRPLAELYLGTHLKEIRRAVPLNTPTGQSRNYQFLPTGLYEPRTSPHDWDAHMAFYVPGHQVEEGVGMFVMAYMYTVMDDRISGGAKRVVNGYAGGQILTCLETSDPGLASSWSVYPYSALVNLDAPKTLNNRVFAPISSGGVASSLHLHEDGYLYGASNVRAYAAHAPSCATRRLAPGQTVGIVRAHVNDWIHGNATFESIGTLPTFICGNYDRRTGAGMYTGPFKPTVVLDYEVLPDDPRYLAPSGTRTRTTYAYSPVTGIFYVYSTTQKKWLQWFGGSTTGHGLYASNVVVANDGNVLVVSNQKRGPMRSSDSGAAFGTFVSGIPIGPAKPGRPPWSPYVDPELLNE